MYDLRGTIYEVRFTRYDLRGTIYEARFPISDFLVLTFTLWFPPPNNLSSWPAATSPGSVQGGPSLPHRIPSLAVRSTCWLPYSCLPFPRPGLRRRVHRNGWD